MRPDVEIVPFEGAYVVVANIPEIDLASKPRHLKDRGEYQGSFIRGGDGDRKLTEYQVGSLRANRGQPRYDRDPVDDASMADPGGRGAALLHPVLQRQPRAFPPGPREVALQRLGRFWARARQGKDVLVPSLGGLLTLGACTLSSSSRS